MQVDLFTQATCPDMTVIDKETNKAMLMGFFLPIPYHSRVANKEVEKMEKYQDLARKLKKLWDMKAMVILIVLGALGTTPETLQRRMKDIDTETSIRELQNSLILHTARTLECSLTYDESC